MNSNNQEAEIKLQLTHEIYDKLKELSTGSKNQLNQKNFFFDSAEKLLYQKRWILRIRIDELNGYITVKGPTTIKDAVHYRPEYESILSKKKALSLLQGFHIQSLSNAPCSEIIARFGDMYVLPFLSFNNTRISFVWKEWNFELDKTTIEDEIYYELEIETNPSKMEFLEKEIKNLFHINGWEYKPSSIGKFQRALRMMEKNNSE
ncbi:MAG: CYTH domain-containing protein [Spirochaetales bacterium]|nr:CYTH domain-containing protein [Spirochaetales bacterium]